MYLRAVEGAHFESFPVRALEAPGGAAGEMRDVVQCACGTVSKGAGRQRVVGSSYAPCFSDHLLSSVTVSSVVISLSPVTMYFPGGSGNVGFSMMRPCSSSHQSPCVGGQLQKGCALSGAAAASGD